MRVDPHKYGESVLLAISGGVDSLVMGELFVRANAYDVERPPVKLAVAHCNFHLRGTESDGDAAFVRVWAAGHGLECYVADFQTDSYAKEKNISIEMAARELRYEWFDKLCIEYGFEGVSVAHNANDNAETLFLNLLRGTGIKGLCGMGETGTNPFGATKVFRPMLAYSRADIESYAREQGLQWRTDSTNASSDYRRNRIRNEVFPVLEKLNPSFIATLAEDILHFRQVEALACDYASEYGFDEKGHLPIAKLKSDAHWHYILYELLSRCGFSSNTVADAVSLLEDGDRVLSGKRFISPNFLLITTSKDLIITPRRDTPLAAGGGAHAQRGRGCHRNLPGVAKKGGGEPIVEELRWDGTRSPKTERGVLLVDADKLGGYPSFRPWQNGDWLHPIGLKGKKKVSDLLTDLKYDILEKKNALVLEGDGNHVKAVVGERIDESVRITASTVRVYRISII